MYTEIGGSNVPAFLTKLWRLVEDRNYNDLISWSASGKSFIIRNQAKFAKELLPLYFKHNNMASFIRQLNMYGFRKLAHIENTGLKLENDEIEFYHSCFIKGQENLLEYIKRKNTLSVTNSKNSNTVDEKVNKEDVHCILSDVKGIKGKQESIDNLLVKIQCENEALWKEISTLRHKHQKQQQIVDRLIHFLVSLVQTERIGLKRKLPLMIDNKNDHLSKHTTSSFKSSGPIIQEISHSFLNDQFLPSLPTIDSTSEEQTEIIQLDDQTVVPTVVTSTANLINQEQTNSDNLTINNNKETRAFDPLQESINAMNDDKDIHLIESSDLLNEDDLLNLNTDLPLENQIVTESNNDMQNNDMIQIVNLPSEEISSNNENSTEDNLKLVIPSFSSSSPKNNLVPSTSSVLTTPNITMENFDNHIEGIDSELNNLQEQLLLGNLDIDSNVLMGLFFDDGSQKTKNAQLEYSPKLITENILNSTDNNLIVYGDDKNVTHTNSDDQNDNNNFDLLDEDPNKVTDSNYTSEILFDNDTDLLNENF